MIARPTQLATRGYLSTVILGLIIDRRETGDPGAFEAMTEEELVAEAARLARSLGFAGPLLIEDDNKKSL